MRSRQENWPKVIEFSSLTFTIGPLFAISLIYWRPNNYLSLFSWPVRGETDPELPPHPRQLCRFPLPGHRGPDQLSPTVTYRSETRRPVVIHQRSHSCVYGRCRSFPTDLSALLLGDLYYTRLSLSGVSEHLSHRALLDLYHILHANLSSNVSKVCDADQPSWQKQMQFYPQRFCFPLRSACWPWEFCLSLRQSSLPTPRYDPQAGYPNYSGSEHTAAWVFLSPCRVRRMPRRSPFLPFASRLSWSLPQCRTTERNCSTSESWGTIWCSAVCHRGPAPPSSRCCAINSLLIWCVHV